MFIFIFVEKEAVVTYNIYALVHKNEFMRWFVLKSFSDQKKIDYLNIALLVIFAVLTVLQIVMAAVPAVGKLFSNYIVNILITQSLAILPIVVFFVYCGINVPKEIHITKPARGNIILSIVIGFMVQPVLRFVNALSLCFTNNEITDVVIEISEKIPFAVALLLTAILPAVAEETVFRGAVYRTYKKADPWRAVLMSAFLFGALHGNLNQFLYAMVMGIFFCLLNEATGSIVSSMIAHFITNAISVFAIYFLPWSYEYMKDASELYKKMGMTEMAETIEYYFGDMTLSGQEWMRQMLEATDGVQITLGYVFVNFFPSAMIFGAITWLILKSMSRNAGTWDRFRVTFLGADSVPVEKESKGPYDTEMKTDLEETEGNATLKILTIPLMVTIAIGVLMMFVYETMKMLPEFK